MTVTPPQQTTGAPSRPVHNRANLLPGPAAVLDHVSRSLTAAGEATHTLILVALLRPQQASPLPASTMSTVTAAVTRSIRADDWVGRSGIGDLAVIIRGTISAGETMADRLVRIIDELSLSGVTACAAVIGLDPGLDARTAMAKATANLRTARAVCSPPVVTR